MKPLGIHQLSISAAPGDAIGNEIRQIRGALRAAGHESEIFVELLDSKMDPEVHPYLEYREIASPDNVMLLHYSMASPVSRMAAELDDSLVLIYHNITPPEWFAPYSLRVAHNCAAARLQLARLRPHTALALGVSEYNRQELEEIGFERTAVVPLLLDLDRLDGSASQLVLDRYSNDRPTWLVVGRVAPNKCVEDVIRAFAYFQRYVDDRARLLIVGEHRHIPLYYYDLQRFTREIGVSDVHFVGHVSDDELNAYYRVASILVCLSEHEGFCVPLFEAFRSDLPAIAFAAAGIPYSTGGGLLMLEDKDPALVAETVASVLDDETLRAQLLARQRRVLSELEADRVIRSLFEQLREIGVEA
ncbi:MAG TPA: glycosyltransferase family 4 protein [Acidobacteriota bacterium]|nr:glycosyltransferase family 4 protein [Acidobacteriota bacterium]